MPRQTSSGANAQKIQAVMRKKMRHSQQSHTQVMLQNLQSLDHIPARMRYAYEFYRNALASGHVYATRYKIDNKMHD